jgi:hypothetical protein
MQDVNELRVHHLEILTFIRLWKKGFR